MRTLPVIIASLLMSLSFSVVAQETVWRDGFEAECEWLFIDNDGDGRNWTISENNPHDGLHCLFGGYSPTAEDNWAIGPAISIPGDEGSCTLEWQVFGHANYIESYEVLVTTGASGYLAAYDSLFGESVTGGYFERSINISAYAGQTIRIAFRHRSQNQNFICIDDVSIKHREEMPPQPPIVTIAAPTTAKEGETVTMSVQCENAEHFLWDIEGAEPSSPESRTTTATWHSQGRYRISVTATNDDGSSTADHIITILPSNGMEEHLDSAPSPLLYPNPTMGVLSTRLPSVTKITITDAYGRTIAQSHSSTIDISSLPGGIYTATISSQTAIHTEKIIKR